MTTARDSPPQQPPTVNANRTLYGADKPPLDDLAENYHEASKLNTTFARLDLRGMVELASSDELIHSSLRAVKETAVAPSRRLPPPGELGSAFGEVLRRRRSIRSFAPRPVGVDDIATLLHAAYGLTAGERAADDEEGLYPALRTVPSGGALFPLELYLLAFSIEGLAPGLYHYHPPKHALEELVLAELRGRVRDAIAQPELAADAACLIVVSAVFWRSRFKYGLRGYRFALLEAGHVGQNVLLAAAALGLRACPFAGFYDRRLDRLLDLDGVDESALYTFFVGRPAEGA